MFRFTVVGQLLVMARELALRVRRDQRGVEVLQFVLIAALVATLTFAAVEIVSKVVLNTAHNIQTK